MSRILVVDDDRSLREMLEIVLRREKLSVESAASGTEALDRLRQEPYDLVICDIRLRDESGVDVLKEARRIRPDTLFIMVTAYASSETAIETLRYGAYDYITKPFNVDELLHIVRQALEKKELRQEINLLKGESVDRSYIIGKSAKMIEIYKTIGTVAVTESTVLITGDSGTGKELVARAIHAASLRKDAPFVTINCSAFPETLLESELFGYMKGAFTGATGNKIGLFEVANRGTLFLDEIAEMPPGMQVKLLRVMQERVLRRLGGTEEQPLDVRVIVATNRNLLHEIAQGRFREDLYYRISVIPIHLPPLRERPEDIPLLANFFLQRYAPKMNKAIAGFSEEAMRRLKGYAWPGNVRELENVVERAVALEFNQEIQADRLANLPPAAHMAGGPQESPLPEGGFDLEAFLLGVEKRILLECLERYDWNRVKVAEHLRLSYRSLRHKLKIHQIQRG
jgi:two-component system, NtrC family, response regulator PilR